MSDIFNQLMVQRMHMLNDATMILVVKTVSDIYTS